METGNFGRWEVKRPFRMSQRPPYSGEGELVEPTSSRKMGHQVRDVVAIPQSKSLTIIVSV